MFLNNEQAHHSKCSRYPIVCPNQCDSPKVVREELESHLKENCPALMVCCPFKEAGCRYKGPRYSLEKHQEDVQRQHLLLMCGLASRQQQQLSALRSTVSRISTNYTGTFLWRINDVGIKINEATIKEGFELISAPFYTSQYGYKLQVMTSHSTWNRYLILYYCRWWINGVVYRFCYVTGFAVFQW